MMRIFLAAALCSLAACSFAPDYTRPATAPVPQHYKEAGDWIAAQPSDAIERGAWWKSFGDPGLDALETEVAGSNEDLKAALARFQQARAEASVARADYFPAITGNAGVTRQRNSRTVALPSSAAEYNNTLLSADFSYELDVWGRVRNAVSAAENRAKASEADLAAVDLSLHAELAADYFALRGDDAAQRILEEAVTSYRKALTLVRNRYKGGAAAEADVTQAETQFENARTQAADMLLKRAQLEHAIAVLTGKIPTNFSLKPAALSATLPALRPGLPSTLLERRPDIAEAERLTEAANAEIGVARAAWFPSFSLGGTAGYESAAAAHLLSAPSLFWSLGPSAAVTLFDAGKISALSQEARAAYDETAANYRKTVLTAYQEVEDNLVALRRLRQESASQNAAAKAARRTLVQANNRYVGGITTYLDVSIAQNDALQAELNSVDIHTRELTAGVQLIKALGGGWQQHGGP